MVLYHCLPSSTACPNPAEDSYLQYLSIRESITERPQTKKPPVAAFHVQAVEHTSPQQLPLRVATSDRVLASL